MTRQCGHGVDSAVARLKQRQEAVWHSVCTAEARLSQQEGVLKDRANMPVCNPHFLYDEPSYTHVLTILFVIRLLVLEKPLGWEARL